MTFRNFKQLVAVTVFASSSISYAFFLTGEGHYGIRSFSQTKPAFSNNTGLYQGSLQSFRLLTEFKGGDNLSMNLGWTLFDDPTRAYLGDHSQPEECATTTNGTTTVNGEDVTTRTPNNSGSTTDCADYPQDNSSPGYQSFSPKIREAWVQYDFETCLFEAGRKPRHWGRGVFLNKGNKLFDMSASIFDGMSCSLNLQKVDTIQFTGGFDKLAESKSSYDLSTRASDSDNVGGGGRMSDDIDQFFLAIEYDNRKNQGISRFSRHIGLYFANISGKSYFGEAKEEVETDVKFADFFTGFYWPSLKIENEFVFRLGKSSDPTWARHGGVSQETTGLPQKNNLNSIALAGELEWTLSQEGSFKGPAEFNEGDLISHNVTFEYAYAPGDADGYRTMEERRSPEHLSSSKKVEAFSFHRNYKPAYLLLSDNPSLRKYRIDGVYDPARVTNMTLFSIGYLYRNLLTGDVSVKFITAQMNETVPANIKAAIRAQEDADRVSGDASARRPIGYSGKQLGYELDIAYSRTFGKQLSFDLVGAIGLPGKAWDIQREDSIVLSYLVQAGIGFKF